MLIKHDQEIFSRPDLDLLEKLILSYVKDWESKGLACYAKDGFLAGFFGVSLDAVNLSLVNLERLGLIEQVKGSGGRIIKSLQSVKQESPKVLDVFDLGAS